jgi:hypothetical protein
MLLLNGQCVSLMKRGRPTCIEMVICEKQFGCAAQPSDSLAVRISAHVQPYQHCGTLLSCAACASPRPDWLQEVCDARLRDGYQIRWI